MLFNLTGAQYKSFLQMFNSVQNDGKIGTAEIRAILSTRGVTATGSQIQKIIDSVSVDPSGISLQAFVDYASAFHQLRDSDTEMQEAWRIYDKDGSGTVERGEIEYIMSKIGVKIDVQALMDEIDINKDGVVSFDEFTTLMKRKY